MNELQSLDILERIRAWVLQRRPETETELARAAAISRPLSASERKIKSLAGFLGIEDDTATHRRLLRRMVRDLELQAVPGDRRKRRGSSNSDDAHTHAESHADAEAGEEPNNETDLLALSVREEASAPLPPLTPARRKQILRIWTWAERGAEQPKRPLPALEADKGTNGNHHPNDERSDGAALPASPGLSPESLLRSFREDLPFLKGIAPYRVLRALGYDVALPDSARQRLLFRLGFTTASPGASDEQRFETFEAMAQLSRLSGDSLRGIGHLFGLFACAGPEAGGGVKAERVGLCRARPLCRACPVCDQCLFHRFGSRSRPGRGAGRIKDWATEDRPRERVAHHGVESLADAELLAILLRTGTGELSAVDLARDLLKRFESLDRLDQASIAELETHRGIGPAKAAEIKSALELGKRVLRSPLATGGRLTSSREVFQAMRSTLSGQKREQFLLLALNTKNEILRVITVSIGSLSQSLVHPREVFREAIREAAASVMLIHNHPSGDPAPSRDDEQITQRLCRAGELLGIRVLDHVIVGHDRYFSFADEGRLEAKG